MNKDAQLAALLSQYYPSRYHEDPDQRSPLERILDAGLLDTLLSGLSDAEIVAIGHDWNLTARPKQRLPEGDWFICLVCAGRGFGKNHAGANWITERAKKNLPGDIVICAPTAADLRTKVLEASESGLLSLSEPDFRPRWEPSKTQIIWPNGARAVTLTLDKPDRGRGFNSSSVWLDELAAARYGEDAFDQLVLGCRAGPDPRILVTTTPKPVNVIKKLIERDDVPVVRGITYENKRNLSHRFIAELEGIYAGTRKGRQEIYAELLSAIEGSFISHELIDNHRVTEPPDMRRIIVAIDPAVTSKDGSDETGITVEGLGIDGEGYVLEDASCRATPDQWARRAIELFEEFQANMIIGEANNGGDLIEHTLRTINRRVPYKSVRATRGKHKRFEPVAGLIEQGRIHMVGSFPELEDQICGFTPAGYEGSNSPDRADSFVWGINELMIEPRPEPRIRSL